MLFRRLFSRDRRRLVVLVFILFFTVVVMVLVSGCTTQQRSEEKNTTSRIPEQLITITVRDCIPTPTTANSISSNRSRTYNLIFSDFRSFLAEWNKVMEWGFSDQQIDEFNHTLRCGRLMKYQSVGWKGAIAWSVEDIHDFCLDVGDEIGLPKDQSEFFAASADDYYHRGKMTFHGAVPTRHFISFDHCNISIERGKQAQINMTYRFAWDDPPATVRFSSSQTPFTLAYSPSEIALVKPFREYPAVALITADSTLKPEVYQLRISIEGKNQTEYTCRDIDTGTIRNNILSVTVV